MDIYNKDIGSAHPQERRLHPMKKQPDNSKITALYERLSHDDERAGESVSIENQELLCRGWFLPPNTYDCGSFVVNGTAVVGKEPKKAL